MFGVAGPGVDADVEMAESFSPASPPQRRIGTKRPLEEDVSYYAGSSNAKRQRATAIRRPDAAAGVVSVWLANPCSQQYVM